MWAKLKENKLVTIFIPYAANLLDLFLDMIEHITLLKLLASLEPHTKCIHFFVVLTQR